MKLVAASLLLLATVMPSTARAQDDPDSATAAVAESAGVVEEDLRAALATLAAAGINVSAHDYLFPPPASVANGSVWDRIAQCESTGHWDANTGNGYFGGTQTAMQTWKTYGGMQYAARPDLATRAQQIAVNERILAAEGWQAWPFCSRRLGLR